jgi:hypothetical protein
VHVTDLEVNVIQEAQTWQRIPSIKRKYIVPLSLFKLPLSDGVPEKAKLFRATGGCQLKKYGQRICISFSDLPE